MNFHKLYLFYTIIFCSQIVGCTDEINSITEYEYLRLMDVKKYDSITTVTVVSEGGYHFAVIPCTEEKVFVLLNPKYEPLYKQIGSCNYSLTAQDTSLIARNTPTLDPTVRECLYSHVSDWTN